MCPIAAEDEVEGDFDFLWSAVVLILICLCSVRRLRGFAPFALKPGFAFAKLGAGELVVEEEFHVR